MNVRSIDEFRADIDNSPLNTEQAGRDFDATVRLRQDIESYFDLRGQMQSDDVELVQKNIAGRLTSMDLAINPNKAQDASKVSGLGVGEIISRFDRQHYAELLYDTNEVDLLSRVDDGAVHVAKSLGWSEDRIMDEFLKYDREQALKEIEPQLNADSEFFKNMILEREGYDASTKPVDLPYYIQKELENYESAEHDMSFDVSTDKSVKSNSNNFFEAKNTDLLTSDDAHNDAYKVKSDFKKRMYNTAFDDFGFDEKFDDDDFDY